MTDSENLKAVCCLAGVDRDVTVEDLQLLDRLVKGIGLEPKPFHGLIEKTRANEEFREEQIDLAKANVDDTLKELIRVVRQDASLNEGRIVMLLWRVATKVEMTPEHFQELIGPDEGAD